MSAPVDVHAALADIDRPPPPLRRADRSTRAPGGGAHTPRRPPRPGAAVGRAGLVALAAAVAGACSSGGGGTGPATEPCAGVTCQAHASCVAAGATGACACDPGYAPAGAGCALATAPAVGGCQVLPADHAFNTPVDGWPVHPSSAAFIATIGAGRPMHLDLGTSVDMAAADYYGIPYNVVRGDALPWVGVTFATRADIGWNPLPESDCGVASGGGQAVASPCTTDLAPAPIFPVPPSPLVEGGLATGLLADGDHHLLVVDAAACRLWELYHATSDGHGGWDVWGAATFDLGSNALRPAGWTSADAAGFPILPLLLRTDEASRGEIRHALRFTIPSGSIRTSYVWPARHLTTAGSGSATLPPMGQLFRLKASYPIPAGFTVQARAILQALKTYGAYVADGGSAMYFQGEPSADWLDDTISQVRAVTAGDLEAVDQESIASRPGFDPDSARVPPP